jgi:hypothetical protein
MAKTWVIVVGHARQEVSMTWGDNLKIAFCSPYKFCVTSGNAGAFEPPLPTGKTFKAGDVWPKDGVVSVAKKVMPHSKVTVTWTHMNEGEDCPPIKITGGAGVSPLGGGGHSIVISGS